MEIVFILYQPAVSGNVGASARALKTMGFRHLRLIRPCEHLNEEARMMAHGSHEILENAPVFNDPEEALADLDMLICTTAKERSAKHDYHSIRELGTFLEQRKTVLQRVGILFGTEESGLPNRLVLRSDMAVTIPMASGYPSLNLAQGVMITAYELSPLNRLTRPGKALSKQGEGYRELKSRTRKLLAETGIPEGSPLFHRIMERLATVGANDIPLFLSVISRIEQNPDHE